MFPLIVGWSHCHPLCFPGKKCALNVGTVKPTPTIGVKKARQHHCEVHSYPFFALKVELVNSCVAFFHAMGMHKYCERIHTLPLTHTSMTLHRCRCLLYLPPLVCHSSRHSSPAASTVVSPLICVASSPLSISLPCHDGPPCLLPCRRHPTAS